MSDPRLPAAGLGGAPESRSARPVTGDVDAPAAVILAAGEGRRMGTPKARLLWRGRTFVEHVIDLACASGCGEVVVVSGALRLDDLADAFDARQPGRVRWIHNEDFALGVSTSLRLGLRHALTPNASSHSAGDSSEASPRAVATPPGVLVLAVDRPHLRVQTVRAIIETARARPTAIVQPAHGGRRGHPILWPHDLAQALCLLSDDATPRELLAQPAVAARRVCIDTDDPAIFDDLDAPEDLARLP